MHLTRTPRPERAALATRTRAALLGLVMTAVLLAGAAATALAAPSQVADGIRFTYREPNAQSVSIAGDFNAWSTSANPMKKGADGVWSVVVKLPPGENMYKFVVDGQWFADPENGATAGEFGNSVVRLGPDGALLATQATSNTPLSPKIFMDGRIIGLYQAIHDPDSHRYELSRPSMDVDLHLNTRFSDVLEGDFLLKMVTQPPDYALYENAMSLDRAMLKLRQNKLQILAYDNMDVGTWDDPLHLVGDIGIYGYPYGYERQGVVLQSQHFGLDTELHYADNFRAGGNTYPAPATSISPELFAAQVLALPIERDGAGGWQLASGGRNVAGTVIESDNNEDMLAFRTHREIGHGLRAGLLARTDRGWNLAATSYVRSDGPDAFVWTVGNTESEWYAVGPELSWKHPAHDLTAHAEYLHGVSRAVFVAGLYGDAVSVRSTVTVDSTGVVTATPEPVTIATGSHFDLDHSDRYAVGGRWGFAQGDIALRTDLSVQTHDYQVALDGIKNRWTTYQLGWDRDWRYYLGREVKTSLDLRWDAYHYDARTPWEYQMLFPRGNFWLENGEHLVGVDRMVLLGGGDIVAIRPVIEVPLAHRRNVTLRYAGDYAATRLGRLPKYAESRFQFGIDITSQLRFHTDTRWVKYDDPVLGIYDGYISHFAEALYSFSPGITVGFSYGVDPLVLDTRRNEYADIGRDQFLFDRGATGAVAQSNYYSLGTVIPAAERALQDDRRLQIEARVKF